VSRVSEARVSPLRAEEGLLQLLGERNVSVEPLAEVRLSCGRFYLSVAGIAVAMEGDKCREGDLPDEVYPPIPDEELATATIGGEPIADMDPRIIRVFRGERWTESMLRYVAGRINEVSRGG